MLYLRPDQLYEIRRVLTDDDRIWSSDLHMMNAINRIEEIVHGSANTGVTTTMPGEESPICGTEG